MKCPPILLPLEVSFYILKFMSNIYTFGIASRIEQVLSKVTYIVPECQGSQQQVGKLRLDILSGLLVHQCRPPNPS